MHRENNIYTNTISGEVLDTTKMLAFVKSEAKRQYEEITEERFNDMNIGEQMECYLQQWNHQLVDRDWMCINKGIII